MMSRLCVSMFCLVIAVAVTACAARAFAGMQPADKPPASTAGPRQSVAAPGDVPSGGTSADPQEVKPEKPSTESGVELLPVEANLVHYVNRQRRLHGLPPLEVCPRLQQSARRHCLWMAKTGLLRHTSDPVAENIAMGQDSSAEAVRSWMNSPGHRYNILGPYRYIGAAAYRSVSGTAFWCLQFRR